MARPRICVRRHCGFGVATANLVPGAQGEGERFHHGFAVQLGLLSEGVHRLPEVAVICHEGGHRICVERRSQDLRPFRAPGRASKAVTSSAAPGTQSCTSLTSQ